MYFRTMHGACARNSHEWRSQTPGLRSRRTAAGQTLALAVFQTHSMVRSLQNNSRFARFAFAFRNKGKHPTKHNHTYPIGIPMLGVCQ